VLYFFKSDIFAVILIDVCIDVFSQQYWKCGTSDAVVLNQGN